MRNYTEMTREEITRIINKGGADKAKLTKMVTEHLDSLKLSEKARDIISSTDLNSQADCFAGLFTAEEVERYINENY